MANEWRELERPFAVRFAEIRALLTRWGELISDFDMLIGATALHYHLTVLTFNLHYFSRILDPALYQPDYGTFGTSGAYRGGMFPEPVNTQNRLTSQANPESRTYLLV
jgi:hypothetical protein